MKIDSGTPALRRVEAFACLAAIGLFALSAGLVQASEVRLVHVPHGGIQPQAVVDAHGVLRLVYFAGNPRAGNLFYVCQKPGKRSFSTPIRVNSQPDTAIAVGSIRGAQLALGRKGRLHVVWNGSKPSNNHRGPALWYTHLNQAGTAFAPQRDVITYAGGLDGGGSVAADDQGDVYAVWHGFRSPKRPDEADRAVFVARSTDDGQTFAPEFPALPAAVDTGCCACCGLRAFVAPGGDLFILYRAVRAEIHRDETLLCSPDQGAHFVVEATYPWRINYCPMSSASLSAGQGGVMAAWEMADGVHFAHVALSPVQVGASVRPAQRTSGKHPVVATNGQGETLVAWTEGTGWDRGGELAWELYNAHGQPMCHGRAKGVPAWGLVAAVARPDNDFLILY